MASKKQIKYAVVDIEMTPDSIAHTRRIIQWSVVIIEKEKIIFQESSFVNPGCPVHADITKLTSITNEQIENAPTLQVSLPRLKHLLTNHVIVGQNIQFDLQVISEEIKRIGEKPLQIAGWIDTVEWSRFMYPTLLSYKLQDLVQACQIPLQSAHLADEDARATAHLFLRLQSDWNRLSLGVKKRLIPILYTLHSDFSFIMGDAKYHMELSERDWKIFSEGCIFKEKACKQTFFAEKISPKTIKKRLQNIDEMRQNFPSYEYREDQVTFFLKAIESWKNQMGKAFEVQPGLGKTFGYILAGLTQLDEKNKQLLITTSTKHLQAQIQNEQIPLVEKFFQRKISSCVLKGAHNYICLPKFLNQLTTHDENYDIRLTKAQILVWLQSTKTGDMDELNLTPNGEQFFSLCACTQKCLLPDHTKNRPCFYTMHMKNACSCDVLIVNHAMFVQYVLQKAARLQGCKIVIDEAHDLEKAINQCGVAEIDFLAVFFYLSQIGLKGHQKLFDAHIQVLRKYGEDYSKVDEQLNLRLYELKHIISSLQQGEINLSREKVTILETLEKILLCIQKEITCIENLWQRLYHLISEKDQKVWVSFLHYLMQLEQATFALQKYIQVFDANCNDMSMDMHGCFSITDFEQIRKALGNLKKLCKRVIFCSGTLLVYGRENFFLEGLNLKDEMMVETIGKVQAYENLTVYLPSRDKIQPVTKEDICGKVKLALRFLVEKGHQKILILCNSKEMVEDLYATIRKMDKLERFEVLAQGKTSRSKEKLYQMFKSLRQGILLGAHSFYEGVDFPDEICTAVILPTLPFLSPAHPYVKIRQERCDFIEPLVFVKILLPSSLLLFRQALGRLKRGTRIKKDFILLDERILSRSYKKLFLQTIELENKETFHLPLFFEKNAPK